MVWWAHGLDPEVIFFRGSGLPVSCNLFVSINGIMSYCLQAKSFMTKSEIFVSYPLFVSYILVLHLYHMIFKIWNICIISSFCLLYSGIASLSYVTQNLKYLYHPLFVSYILELVNLTFLMFPRKCCCIYDI